MQTLKLDNDLIVFGIVVETFPAGISQAFDELIEQTGDSAGQRNYYGISICTNDKIVYKAVVAEKYEGEAAKFNYEKDIIKKGAYLYNTLYHWRNKTNLIKDIFSEMMNDKRADAKQPAIEWYKSDDEMLCMIKTKHGG